MSIDTYKLTSTEEPTDEVLQALMEKVAQTARESNAKAEAEKRRRHSPLGTNHHRLNNEHIQSTAE